MKATSYNRFAQKFNANLKGLGFVKLEDLYEENPDGKYTITGMFINKKNKYGDRPYLSTPDFMVDLPKHMLNTIQDMIYDEEVVDEVNAGIVGFKVVTYYSKSYDKDCYSIEFVTMK